MYVSEQAVYPTAVALNLALAGGLQRGLRCGDNKTNNGNNKASSRTNTHTHIHTRTNETAPKHTESSTHRSWGSRSLSLSAQNDAAKRLFGELTYSGRGV